MQVQTTFAIFDIGRGGRATRNGGPQDIAVKSPMAVAGRSGVGRSDGGALTVGHIGVKGARVPRSQKGALVLSKDGSRLGIGREGRGVLCPSPRHRSD